jgi:beta-lactamase class A
LVFWFYTSNKAEAPTIDSSQATNSENTDNSQVATEPEFDNVALQKVVDDWTASVGGVSSVYISDTDGKIVASNMPSDIYFTASIYKLYVAYAGYQQVDAGEVDPSEVYVNGYTREECLDKMIRESYSPCAEKLWNEIGKAELTAQLKTYGINNTNMEGITTTAEDSGIMLARIAMGDGLSSESKAAYLSSMKDQEAKYRRGLPSGFSTLTVYNKVGWNELVEWHDSAIVELTDGRKLIVTVMSENVGYSNVAKLGSAIEAELTN